MDENKLLQKLQSLAVHGLVGSNDGVGVLSRRGGEVSIVRVLRLIDATIMSRLLTISAGSQTLAMLVTNRRVVSIDDSTSPDLIDVPAEFLETAEDPALALAEAIVTLCSTDAAVNVTSELPENALAPASRGAAIAVARLAEVMGVDIWSEDANPFFRFADAIEGFCTTSLMLQNGNILAESGDPSRLELMKSDHATTFGDAATTADETWVPRLQLHQFANDDAVIVAIFATHFLCADVEADNVSDALAAWADNFE